MSGAKYLLDTNAVLGFLSGQPWATSLVASAVAGGAPLAVSVITRMELLGFPGISEDEASAVSRFLAAVWVVPLTREVETEAVRIRRTHRLKLPDAIVAATSLVIRARLVTADRQVADLPGLDAIDPTRD